MAIPIRENNTIIEYLDATVELQAARNEPVAIMALNKFEWLQLINLIKHNYKEAATRIEFDIEEGTHAMYNGVFLYYDGGDSMDSRSLYEIEDIRHELARRRNQNMNPTVDEDSMMYRPPSHGRTAQNMPRNTQIRPVRLNTVTSAGEGWGTTALVSDAPEASGQVTQGRADNNF